MTTTTITILATATTTTETPPLSTPRWAAPARAHLPRRPRRG